MQWERYLLKNKTDSSIITIAQLSRSCVICIQLLGVYITEKYLSLKNNVSRNGIDVAVLWR